MTYFGYPLDIHIHNSVEHAIIHSLSLLKSHNRTIQMERIGSGHAKGARDRMAELEKDSKKAAKKIVAT